MARKTKEESARTRERILDAAEMVFAKHGVANATLAHIAETAGVSRGAIYGHYKNKIEVCLAMCHRAFESAALPPRYFEEVSALDALYLCLSRTLRMISMPTPLQRTVRVLYFLCEDTEEAAPLLRFRNAMELRHRRDVLLLLRRAMRQGELSADLDLPLAYAYLDSLMGGIYHAHGWPRRLRRDFWQAADRLLYSGIEGMRDSLSLRRRSPLPPPIFLTDDAIPA